MLLAARSSGWCRCSCRPPRGRGMARPVGLAGSSSCRSGSGGRSTPPTRRCSFHRRSRGSPIGASAISSASTGSRCSWCSCPPRSCRCSCGAAGTRSRQAARVLRAAARAQDRHARRVLALDLFLFYCFWELMLIPMYFLIGIWGSGNRLYAIREVLHLHLLGIAADAGGDRGDGMAGRGADRHLLLRVRPSARQRRPAARVAPWLFAAFALAFAVKVPVFPVPYLAARRPRRGAHRRQRAAGGRPPQDGHLRVPAVRGALFSGGRARARG